MLSTQRRLSEILESGARKIAEYDTDIEATVLLQGIPETPSRRQRCLGSPSVLVLEVLEDHGGLREELRPRAAVLQHQRRHLEVRVDPRELLRALLRVQHLRRARGESGTAGEPCVASSFGDGMAKTSDYQTSDHLSPFPE